MDTLIAHYDKKMINPSNDKAIFYYYARIVRVILLITI